MTAAVTTRFPARSYVVIGGDRSPGRVTVRGFNSPRGWDERQGYGLSGATLVPKGDPLARGSLIFEFWDDAQIPDWYAFAGKYFDKAVRLIPGSRKPRVLGIYHPILAAPPIRITEVVVEDCSQLEEDPESGMWGCEVMLKQYRKPVPAPQAPAAAIPPAQQPQPTAQDAADREIEQLLQQLAGLPK